MPLFKITNSNITDARNIRVKNPDLSHITRSLRAKINDILYFTNSEEIFKSRITMISKDILEAHILSSRPVKKGNRTKLTLYIAMIKHSQFEMILNTATQLGVDTIIPMDTEFSCKIKASEEKLKRWNKIIFESAKQSFNPSPPALKEMTSFTKAVAAGKNGILLHPDSAHSIKEHLDPKTSEVLNVYIGPEGGFSKHEIKLAQKNKINIVKLPYHILRTETAVIAVISNILFFYS